MDTILVDLVRYGHLLSVAVGLGAAAMADYTAMTGLRRRVSPEFLTILKTAHNMIWPALIAMWITGLALIGIRTGFDLSAFSPKLFAKLTVVTLLTANAHAIGKLAMPLMAQNTGLGALSQAELRACAVMGGVSSASWLLALAMGSSKVLAAAPAGVFLLLVPIAYGAAIFVSFRTLAWMRGPKAAAPIRPIDRRKAGDLQVTSYKIGLFPRRTARS
ncbi:MAG: hypothetical protein AAGF88_08495 [Pseudomonadota bacterium]